MAQSKKAGFKLFGKTGVIVVAAVVSTALITVYANLQKGVECFQNALVVPVVKIQFDKLHAPFADNQDSVIRNQKIIIEMQKIYFGDSTGHIKNEAIERVDKAGRF